MENAVNRIQEDCSDQDANFLVNLVAEHCHEAIGTSTLNPPLCIAAGIGMPVFLEFNYTFSSTPAEDLAEFVIQTSRDTISEILPQGGLSKYELTLDHGEQISVFWNRTDGTEIISGSKPVVVRNFFNDVPRDRQIQLTTNSTGYEILFNEWE